MKARLQLKAKRRDFASASAYVRELIREDLDGIFAISSS
jgi:Arc/MetJ-type ribon-helix-helix transcriptional regulator